MKKKLLTVLMAGIMTLSLVACGNGTTKETASTEDATESSVANGDEDGMGEKKVVVAFSQNTTSDPWRVAQTNDIKRVAKERGYELVFEFQRRADLIRFGKYEEVVNAHLKKLGIAQPTNVTSSLRYFPYPLNDAQLNPNLAAENPSRLPK